MAGSSLLALIDDIATLLDDVSVIAKVATKKTVGALDDVSVLTKVATQKTAGVLGDDLALNAQQVTGLAAERELPVVWAVAQGSLRNKAILVPAALAISAFVPWAVTPLLMIGGAFLCFEGAEKLAHKFLHSPAEDEARRAELTHVLEHPEIDLVAFERERIEGAVRTDFILSAEIIAITLGTVADAPFTTQVAVLVGIAILMTVGVYGFVAGIVKLDDAGLWLSRRAGALARLLGRGILGAAPWMMKSLSVLGTAAMFLVGGGILSHGLPFMHGFIERSAHASGHLPAIGNLAEALTPMLLDGLLGVGAGVLIVALVTGVKKLRGTAH